MQVLKPDTDLGGLNATVWERMLIKETKEDCSCGHGERSLLKGLRSASVQGRKGYRTFTSSSDFGEELEVSAVQQNFQERSAVDAKSRIDFQLTATLHYLT